MDQVWVCGSCRSINQPRERRCYRCRTPREIGEADPTSMPVSGEVPKPASAAAAAPAFESSAGLAMTAQLLILVAVGVVAAAGVVIFLGRTGDGEEFLLLGFDGVLLLGAVQLAVALAAIAAFAGWLSRVVANVPALGGGFTNVTPTMAFIENFIPVANLFRIPAILRDVMTRLEAGGRGDALMIGSWLAFVAALFLPRLNVFVAFVSTDLADALEGIAVIGLVAVVLQGVGGVLLVLLIQHIESVVAARRANPAPAAASLAPVARPDE